MTIGLGVSGDRASSSSNSATPLVAGSRRDSRWRAAAAFAQPGT
jgi:hypothetical protein